MGVKYDRVNTFEAFTNIGAGINYDDDAAFGTVANLTMNLEGEVNLGNILLGDTNNGDGSDPLSNDVPGRVISTNYLGDISLNAGSVDELVDITIEAVDISDADISLLSIDANDHSGDLEIGGI